MEWQKAATVAVETKGKWSHGMVHALHGASWGRINLLADRGFPVVSYDKEQAYDAAPTVRLTRFVGKRQAIPCRSNHMPTTNFQASYNRTRTINLSTINNDQTMLKSCRPSLNIRKFSEAQTVRKNENVPE